MKYEAEINGNLLSIELEESGGRVSALIDGERRYLVEATRHEEGIYSIFVGDRVYEARVWQAGPNLFCVNLRGQDFNVSIIDRRHRRSAAATVEEGQQFLTAPMPGRVVRVLLGPGDEVKAGQGVVVVEAMKMQNEIKSPKSGRIVEVRVAEGATVNANQVVAVVE
jgi:biotin carboxyl carrier protein